MATPTRRPRPKPRRRIGVASAVFLALLFAAVVVVRTSRFEHAVAARVQHEIAAATGLRVDLGRTSFSLWTFSVRIENLDIVRPGTAPLAHVDALEVTPSLAALLKGEIQLTRLDVEGGRVDLLLRTRDGALQIINGPEVHPSGSPGGGELPFRDIAVSDLRVHVSHESLGSLDLASVDLDVVNAPGRRLMIGLLADGGAVHSAQLDGPVQRLEARLAIDLGAQRMRVAMAHLGVGRITAEVRDATLDLPHQTLAADARIAAPVADLLRFVPQAPGIEGDVAVDARGRVDLVSGRFDATAVVNGHGLGLLATGSDGAHLRYSLGDAVHLRAHATPERVAVTEFRASYAGATVVSPALTVGLQGTPSLAGHVSFAGLDFTRLMADATVTRRTKILWTLGAELDLHGTLAPLRLVADIHEVDSRDFAVLRDFFQVRPQKPVVHVGRARISGQMLIDPTALSWVNMVATFGHSRVTVSRVRVRLAHDPRGRDPDLIIENIRGDTLHLDDLGTVADLPIAGDAVVAANLRGDFADPPMDGVARIRNFSLGGLPFGDFETPPGTAWHYRNVRVDVPLLVGHHRRSSFELRDAYLDFRRYAIRTGAHVHTGHFLLADFYNMFHFEGDPSFAPFDGEGAGDVDVDYVLGRPGDDRDGVMSVDATLHDWNLSAFGEQLTGVGTHASFTWLRRRDGARGARTRIDWLRGAKGAGTIELAGSMDPGGRLHFVGAARNVALASLDLVHTSGAPVAGTLAALVAVEGTPDAPRVTADATVQNLTTVGRNVGRADVHLAYTPEGPAARTATERPPVGRVQLDVRALDDQLRAAATLRTPWEPSRWRDVLGVEHRDYSRAWGASVLAGAVDLARPQDLLPWLPPSVLARLGPGAVARARVHADIDRARLDDFLHADGRALIDTLDAGAGDARFTLSPGAALVVCVRRGTWWLATPAVGPAIPGTAPGTTLAACARMPDFVRGDAPPTPTFDEVRPQVLGPGGTRLWLAGGGTTEGRYAATARGEFDLGGLVGLMPGVAWARGTGVLQASASNTSGRVALVGSLALAGGALGVAALPWPVEDIDLLVRFQGTDAVFERARAHLGAGSIDLSRGVVRFAGSHLERVDVPVTVRGLAVSPSTGVDVALDADGWVRKGEGDELPLVGGDVTLTRVRYTRPFSLSVDLSGRLRGQGAAAPERQYDPSGDSVRFELNLHTRNPVRVVNNVADAEMVISNERRFRLVGTDQRYGVVGTVEVPRGVVRLYGSEFEIRRGRVDFDNPERIQPNFDVLAATEIRRTGDTNRSLWRVLLHASGTPERLALDMTAEPTLTQEDIVLLLLFRLTRAEMDRLAVLNLGQALAIETLSTVTGLDRAVRGVIPLVDEFRLGSAYNPRTLNTEPQVSVGGQIGDRMRIGVSTTVSNQPLQRATGDVRLGSGFSLQGVVEGTANQGGSSLGSINLGTDLRWRLEF